MNGNKQAKEKEQRRNRTKERRNEIKEGGEKKNRVQGGVPICATDTNFPKETKK